MGRVDKMVKKLSKTDDNTIKGIYTLAKLYATRLSYCDSSYLDRDDLIQEGMIAYLQGRHIKQGILTAFRASTTLKRYQYGKMPAPIMEQISEETAGDSVDFDKMPLLSKIWDIIAEIFDTRDADILHRRFKQGQTLEKIANHYSLTPAGVKFIVDKSITELQRRLKCLI